MITPKRKKQFIAGAVCPKCSEMDSLVLFPETQEIECVSCGLKQSASQRDEATAQTKPNKNTEQIQSIKITNLTE